MSFYRIATKKAVFALLGSIVLASATGCVISPAPIHVTPTYESPGVGWAWELHTHFGWGWHHPRHGWHRGWR